MRTLGWPYPFRPRSWEEIDSDFAGIANEHGEFRYMSAIVKSVLSSDAMERLAACTSMNDLMVVAMPIPKPPYDLVVVRAPLASLHPPGEGQVLIEHVSVTGRNDKVERPVADAVPLFWRFMIEKFGVIPRRNPH
jgi:hypothetical protein